MVRVERPETTMGPLGWANDHLGLLVLTGISVALTVYLVYVMVRPERF